LCSRCTDLDEPVRTQPPSSSHSNELVVRLTLSSRCTIVHAAWADSTRQLSPPNVCGGEVVRLDLPHAP
jgi:hypothetical protein